MSVVRSPREGPGARAKKELQAPQQVSRSNFAGPGSRVLTSSRARAAEGPDGSESRARLHGETYAAARSLGPSLQAVQQVDRSLRPDDLSAPPVRTAASVGPGWVANSIRTSYRSPPRKGPGALRADEQIQSLKKRISELEESNAQLRASVAN